MAHTGLCLCTEEVSTVVTHPAHAWKLFCLEFAWGISGTGITPFVLSAVHVGSCLATVFQLLVMLSHIFNLM
jgi:hypothetical protein